MLLQCKEATMNTIAFKRMMTGKDDQLFGIACRNITNACYKLISCFAVAIRFYFRLFIRMQPPLTIEKYQGNIITEIYLNGSGASVFGYKMDPGIVIEK